MYIYIYINILGINDLNSNVNIFDVINAQEKFEQGKVLESGKTIFCRGTDPGKFQFPKYASFGCKSMIYVSDNDQNRLGSPRVQAFKLNNLSVSEVLDNRSIKTGNQKSPETYTTCYYPTYQFLIDWNGDIFLCPQDWQRRVTMGNMMQDKINIIIR